MNIVVQRGAFSKGVPPETQRQGKGSGSKAKAVNRLYGKDGRWRDGWGNDRFLLGDGSAGKIPGGKGGFLKFGRWKKELKVDFMKDVCVASNISWGFDIQVLVMANTDWTVHDVNKNMTNRYFLKRSFTAILGSPYIYIYRNKDNSNSNATWKRCFQPCYDVSNVSE